MVHFLWDFNFKDIDWPDRLILIDIMNDYGMEQIFAFPNSSKEHVWFMLTTLRSKFQDVKILQTNLAIMSLMLLMEFWKLPLPL